MIDLKELYKSEKLKEDQLGTEAELKDLKMKVDVLYSKNIYGIKNASVSHLEKFIRQSLIVAHQYAELAIWQASPYTFEWLEWNKFVEEIKPHNGANYPSNVILVSQETEGMLYECFLLDENGYPLQARLDLTALSIAKRNELWKESTPEEYSILIEAVFSSRKWAEQPIVYAFNKAKEALRLAETYFQYSKQALDMINEKMRSSASLAWNDEKITDWQYQVERIIRDTQGALEEREAAYDVKKRKHEAMSSSASIPTAPLFTEYTQTAIDGLSSMRMFREKRQKTSRSYDVETQQNQESMELK